MDLHKQRAAELFDVAEDDVTDKQRRYAKFENYMRMYGAGPRPMLEHWKEAQCPRGHAKPLK